MAEKKKTKKAVAKKAAPKKATAKRAVIKNSAPKKVATKKSSVQRTKGTPTAKTKKSAVKKTTVKKVATKKSPATKSRARKVTTSRATTKKTVSNRAVAKRVSTASVLESSIRTQSVPEVPSRRELKAPIGQVASLAPKQSASKVNTPSGVSGVATVQATSKQNRKDRIILIAAGVIIVIAGVVAFGLPSTNQNSTADGSVNPSPQASANSQPSPDATETTTPEAQGNQTFGLRFSYNSIGITLDFSGAQKLGSIAEYVVKSSENGSPSKVLLNLTGKTSTARIIKIDTVGKTVFVVEAKLSDGTRVISQPLAIRGLFTVE